MFMLDTSFKQELQCVVLKVGKYLKYQKLILVIITISDVASYNKDFFRLFTLDTITVLLLLSIFTKLNLLHVTIKLKFHRKQS